MIKAIYFKLCCDDMLRSVVWRSSWGNNRNSMHRKRLKDGSDSGWGIRQFCRKIIFRDESVSETVVADSVVNFLYRYLVRAFNRSQLQDTNINAYVRSLFFELSTHNVGLSLHNLHCLMKKNYLKNAYNDQQQIEDPITPICRISFGRIERHRGEFADSYGMLCIVGMLLTAIGLGWPIATCFERGWRWRGICLVVLALALDICGCASGIISCLPWDW